MLLVAGTHGNEINAPWLFDQWDNNSDFEEISGINLYRVIGNPLAGKECSRYLDRDLNRSFSAELWNSLESDAQEIKRAKELFNLYGPRGQHPCKIAFDFHSTTAAMGNSLVVYGRRAADLALASLIQFRLGLPIYLHEGDENQKGFLVESWPCGLVVEIGPVPQGLLHQRIIFQTRLVLEVCLEEIAKTISKEACFPNELIVHRHLKTVDFPRDKEGCPNYFIHKGLQDKDWIPIKHKDPLFENINGNIITNNEINPVVPVFINEAAYAEKNIAMAITKREVWNLNEKWKVALKDLLIN